MAETIPSIQIVGEVLESWHVGRCHWLLDQPVSNSGRLKTSMRDIAVEHNWNYEIELCPTPDRVLCNCWHIVASADSQIIDQADRWFNLARAIIDDRVPGAWIIDLSTC